MYFNKINCSFIMVLEGVKVEKLGRRVVWMRVPMKREPTNIYLVLRYNYIVVQHVLAINKGDAEIFPISVKIWQRMALNGENSPHYCCSCMYLVVMDFEEICACYDLPRTWIHI